jgi:hypothetical protein
MPVGHSKGERLILKLRSKFKAAGYMPLAIDVYTSAIRSGRVPPNTRAFTVVDERGGVRFLGNVVVESDGTLFLEADPRDPAAFADELRGVIEGTL